MSASTSESLRAKRLPATPAIAPDSPKTIVLVVNRLTPITAAAVSLSRTATMARPIRLRSRPAERIETTIRTAE